MALHLGLPISFPFPSKRTAVAGCERVERDRHCTIENTPALRKPTVQAKSTEKPIVERETTQECTPAKTKKSWKTKKPAAKNHLPVRVKPDPNGSKTSKVEKTEEDSKTANNSVSV